MTIRELVGKMVKGSASHWNNPCCPTKDNNHSPFCAFVVDFNKVDWFWFQQSWLILKKESPSNPPQINYPAYVFGHIGGWEHLHIEPNGFMGDWICNNVRLVVGGTKQWIYSFFELAFIKLYLFQLLSKYIAKRVWGLQNIPKAGRLCMGFTFLMDSNTSI